jgi:glycosyltransferase involved in cell wall biosynthesis
MQNALISLILPVYNVEQYIDKCMESVLNQTYFNLEILLIDDGSKDSSSEKCEFYAKKDVRVKVFHKENGGLSDARNYGIRKAEGEYIICIDSDDYVDFDYVEYLYDLIKKYHTQMAIAQHRVVFSNGSVNDYGKEGDELLGNKTCIERMCYHDIIDTSAWSKIYAKSLFEDIEYPVGRLFEDIGTTYKLMLKSGEIAVGYESKYNYIVRQNSIVNAGYNPKKLDLLEMTDDMAEDVLDKYPDLEDAVFRRQVYARISTLNQMAGVDIPEKKEIIQYIRRNGGRVLSDPKAPKRDKVAIILIKISYKLYCKCWEKVNKRK